MCINANYNISQFFFQNITILLYHVYFCPFFVSFEKCLLCFILCFMSNWPVEMDQKDHVTWVLTSYIKTPVVTFLETGGFVPIAMIYCNIISLDCLFFLIAKLLNHKKSE